MRPFLPLLMSLMIKLVTRAMMMNSFCYLVRATSFSHWLGSLMEMSADETPPREVTLKCLSSLMMKIITFIPGIILNY